MFAKRMVTKKIKLPILYSKHTPSERRLIRLEYIRLQKGLCYYCKAILTSEPSADIASKDVNSDLFPEHFFTHPIHLHHDHNTDLTIGAVHAHCNAVMWEYNGK